MILSIDKYRVQFVFTIIIGLIFMLITRDLYITIMVIIASVIIMRFIDIDGLAKKYL